MLLAASVTSVGRPKANSRSAQPAASVANKSVQKGAILGAPHEGIRVHGYWTIVVHNKDDSVASRHEFENSLVGWPSWRRSSVNKCSSASDDGWISGCSIVWFSYSMSGESVLQRSRGGMI